MIAPTLRKPYERVSEPWPQLPQTPPKEGNRCFADVYLTLSCPTISLEGDAEDRDRDSYEEPQRVASSSANGPNAELRASRALQLLAWRGAEFRYRLKCCFHPSIPLHGFALILAHRFLR